MRKAEGCGRRNEEGRWRSGGMRAEEWGRRWAGDGGRIHFESYIQFLYSIPIVDSYIRSLYLVSMFDTYRRSLNCASDIRFLNMIPIFNSYTMLLYSIPIFNA